MTAVLKEGWLPVKKRCGQDSMIKGSISWNGYDPRFSLVSHSISTNQVPELTDGIGGSGNTDAPAEHCFHHLHASS